MLSQARWRRPSLQGAAPLTSVRCPRPSPGNAWKLSAVSAPLEQPAQNPAHQPADDAGAGAARRAEHCLRHLVRHRSGRPPRKPNEWRTVMARFQGELAAARSASFCCWAASFAWRSASRWSAMRWRSASLAARASSLALSAAALSASVFAAASAAAAARFLRLVGREDLLGGFAVDQRVVFRSDRIGLDHHAALDRGDRADARGGRLDQRALDRGEGAVRQEQRDQGLADLQLGDRLFDIDAGIGAEGGRGRLHRCLIARVKARSACCTRLPSWPATVSGMSIGFWVMK